MKTINYSELTDDQKKQVAEDSGYELEGLEREDPLFILGIDFEEYAQEFAEDIGAIGKTLEWPAYCINWEHAAKELKMDYSEVTIDGHGYYFRSW